MGIHVHQKNSKINQAYNTFEKWTYNLSKIYVKFHCFKEFNLHHYLCFIIVQHPCANKRNIISILLFFYIRIYWIHTQIKTFCSPPSSEPIHLVHDSVQCTMNEMVKYTGLFAYLANRQDNGPIYKNQAIQT